MFDIFFCFVLAEPKMKGSKSSLHGSKEVLLPVGAELGGTLGGKIGAGGGMGFSFPEMVRQFLNHGITSSVSASVT